jgi:hypothetical protein
MAQRKRMTSFIAGAGMALAACSGSSEPLPAPGDPSGAPNSSSGNPGSPPQISATVEGTPLEGAAKSLAVPPPAISGGTLLMLNDGHTVVASDPDRDMIFVADVKSKTLLASIPTKPGAQPGRAVQDKEGNVHVVLRESGSVVSLKFGAWTLLAEQQVCPAPRGITFDGSRVWVACAGGELVQATSAADRKSFKLDKDLRDVVFANGQLLVTQFRLATVLTVSPENGTILSRTEIPGSKSSRQQDFRMKPGTSTPTPLRSAEPTVAWRMRPLLRGGAVVMHQESSTSELGIEAGGYGGGVCKGGGVVAAAVTTVSADGSVTTSGQLSFATLPVDVDVSSDGKRVAMIFAGNNARTNPGMPVAVMDMQRLNAETCHFPRIEPPTQAELTGSGGMGGMGGMGGTGGDELPAPDIVSADFSDKQPVAVAFDGGGNVIVQSREPAVLTILGRNGGDIVLSKLSREDSGERVFHMATTAGLACASCHPEGGDDGRVWNFQKIGSRRTQNLRGGIVNLAPFHWDGDMKDLGTLMTQVFNGRMQGPQVDGPHLKALANFMDKIKAVPASNVADTASAERGRLLFNDSKVGCATCHTGIMFTNNETVDVGTGKAFQVPTLKGLAERGPYMHTGCAKSLADRFKPECGGGDKHGVTSHLSPAQISDLSVFLETL